MTAGAAVLAVRVIPNARRNTVDGWLGVRLKIRIQCPPVEGKANRELVRFVAELFDVSRGAVAVVRGQTGRDKLVCITGRDPAAVRRRLAELGWKNDEACGHSF